MGFEDRLREAAAAKAEKDRSEVDAATRSASNVAAAQQDARDLLNEVRAAIRAVRSVPVPPTRPADFREQGSLHGVVSNLLLQDERSQRWIVYRQFLVRKEGTFRPKWICVFDGWYFHIGVGAPSTVIGVGTHRVEVQCITAEMGPRPPHPTMTIEQFAELGLLSWETGSWKDSYWQAGSISASDSFATFLDVAARFVVHMDAG